MQYTQDMERSVFLEKEGDTPKNRLLDFFVVYSDFDYSLKDIAKLSKVSYPYIKTHKKGLLKNKWIVLTRNVGKAQMYKLNLKSKVVKKFIEYYWAVVDEAVEEELGIKNKHRSYAPQVAVSAKNL